MSQNPIYALLLTIALLDFQKISLDDPKTINGMSNINLICGELVTKDKFSFETFKDVLSII